MNPQLNDLATKLLNAGNWPSLIRIAVCLGDNDLFNMAIEAFSNDKIHDEALIRESAEWARNVASGFSRQEPQELWIWNSSSMEVQYTLDFTYHHFRLQHALGSDNRNELQARTNELIYVREELLRIIPNIIDIEDHLAVAALYFSAANVSELLNDVKQTYELLRKAKASLRKDSRTFLYNEFMQKIQVGIDGLELLDCQETADEKNRSFERRLRPNWKHGRDAVAWLVMSLVDLIVEIFYGSINLGRMCLPARASETLTRQSLLEKRQLIEKISVEQGWSRLLRLAICLEDFEFAKAACLTIKRERKLAFKLRNQLVGWCKRFIKNSRKLVEPENLGCWSALSEKQRMTLIFCYSYTKTLRYPVDNLVYDWPDHRIQTYQKDANDLLDRVLPFFSEPEIEAHFKMGLVSAALKLEENRSVISLARRSLSAYTEIDDELTPLFEERVADFSCMISMLEPIWFVPKIGREILAVGVKKYEKLFREKRLNLTGVLRDKLSVCTHRLVQFGHVDVSLEICRSILHWDKTLATRTPRLHSLAYLDSAWVAARSLVEANAVSEANSIVEDAINFIEQHKLSWKRKFHSIYAELIGMKGVVALKKERYEESFNLLTYGCDNSKRTLRRLVFFHNLGLLIADWQRQSLLRKWLTEYEEVVKCEFDFPFGTSTQFGLQMELKFGRIVKCNLLRIKGDVSEAIEIIEELIYEIEWKSNLIEKYLVHRWYINALLLAGTLWLEARGSADKASACFEKARNELEIYGPGDAIDDSMIVPHFLVLNNLSVCRQLNGYFDEASSLLKQAARLTERIGELGQAIPKIVLMQIELSKCYYILQLDSEIEAKNASIDLLEVVESQYYKASEKYRSLFVRVLRLVATCEEMLGNHRATINLKQRIVNILKEERDDIEELVLGLCDLASSFAKNGDDETALEILSYVENRADDGIEADVHTLTKARRHLLQGTLELKIGRKSAGVLSLSYAIHAFKEIGTHQYVSERFNAFLLYSSELFQTACRERESNCYMSRQSLEEALHYLLATVELAEKMRHRIISPKRKLENRQQVAAISEYIVECCFLLNELDPTESIRIQHAFKVIERSKSRNLLDLFSLEKRPENTPDVLFSRFLNLRTEIHNLAQTLSIEESLSGTILGFVPPKIQYSTATAEDIDNISEIGPSENKDIGRVFDQTLKEYLDVERQITTLHNFGFDSHFSHDAVSIKKMQKQLPKETLGIELKICDRSGYAILFSALNVEFIQLPNCSTKQVDEFWLEWTRRFKEFESADDWSSWNQFFERSLDQLSNRFFTPLLEAMQMFDNVIVALDRQFHLIPFAACSLSDDVRLCETTNIYCVPSFSVLTEIKNSERRNNQESVAPTVCDVPNPSLYISTVELNILADKFNTHLTDIKNQAEFLKECESANVLHFSGHGEYRPDNPLESALLINDNESLVTVEEIFKKVRLKNCKLVCLSACESSMFQASQIDEYVSFTSGFLYAGARSIVASLWRVVELPTLMLMSRFYENCMAGHSIAYSLRMGQNWLRGKPDHNNECVSNGDGVKQFITDNENVLNGLDPIDKKLFDFSTERWVKSETPPFADPVYWASFVAHGCCWDKDVFKKQYSVLE